MYIFGYGSIINKATRKDSSSVDMPAKLHGYSRGWITRIGSKNTTALGITRNADKYCNGVLVRVDQDELLELDKREQPAGHVRIRVAIEAVEVLSESPLVIEDEIFAYITEKVLFPSEEYPLIQSYVDTVLFGCFQHGEDFLREFIRTTEGWNSPRINDRHNPGYPRWDSKFVSSQIEKILEEELSSLAGM